MLRFHQHPGALCGLFAILTSCNISDYHEELGDGYVFASESHAYQTIQKSLCEGRDTCVTMEVPPCVADYYNGERYLLISQVPLPIGLGVVDEAQFVDTSDKVLYWIIDKKRDSLLGPMDYNAYLGKRKELKISPGRKLKVHPPGRSL